MYRYNLMDLIRLHRVISKKIGLLSNKENFVLIKLYNKNKNKLLNEIADIILQDIVKFRNTEHLTNDLSDTKENDLSDTKKIVSYNVSKLFNIDDLYTIQRLLNQDALYEHSYIRYQ